MRRIRSWLCACALACSSACTVEPPVYALLVRHPESKCALVMFSGCKAWLAEADRNNQPTANPADTDADADADTDTAQ